jgi:hypothetical protein
MPDAKPLVKAQLVEMDAKVKTPKPGGKVVSVQFNPESLKLSFANQVATPGAGDQSGAAPKQCVGSGSQKLSLQLWFDVTGALPDGMANVDDVQVLTKEVEYFITPADVKSAPQTTPVPPGVRFVWGKFQFDGVVDSMEESLEFFSNDGKPLRASMTLNLTGQKPVQATSQSAGGPGSASPGTRPLAAAQAGASLQGLVDSLGSGADWQSVAAANGIENPRLLQPGQLVDLQAQVLVSLSS